MTFEHGPAEGKNHYSQEQQQEEQEEQPRIYLVTQAVDSPYTKQGYRSAFNDFLRTTVKNQDLRVLLDYKPSVIESKIISHIERLKERNLSRSTINMYCAAVFHFFEINDVSINTRKIKRFIPKDESDFHSTDRPYSVDEIKQILDKCDIRSKVIISLMASTGMRISGLRELRYGDIKKNDEFGLYMIRVYSRSKEDRYYTFCTPECAKYIDAYLDYRKSFGEELKDKSPLIREQFNIDNPFTAKAPRFLSKRMMTHIFEDLLRRSGVNQLQPGQKRRAVMSSHGFRKFFVSESDKANIPFTIRELLSGHRLPNQDEHYNFRTEEEVLAEYVKIIDRVTIDPTKRLQTRVKELESERTEEIDRLKAQLEEKDLKLRQTVEALEIKSKNSIDKIEKEIIKLRNDMILEVITDNEHGGMHCYKLRKEKEDLT